MATAAFAPTVATGGQFSSSVAAFGKRLMSAIMESRMKSAERELRRREALVSDLGRRQDHSPAFLGQTDLLPFKL